MISLSTLSTTTKALKEWAVAVNALAEGQTILLLRKGGIREDNNSFQVTENEVLLYPTYEHQDANLLKPDYATQVTPVPSGWHPEQITINSWAKITDILKVSEPNVVEALLPFHIWNEQFVSTRFNWKPKQPLYILLLRTYKLPNVTLIPYHPQYGGCRSWIDLIEPVSLGGIVPVLNDTEYSHQTHQIRQILQP